MDKNKTYYLSHPYTGSEHQNVEKSEKIRESLKAQGYKLINPIGILNEIDEDRALAKCKFLFDVCDGIILCPGYTNSRGCVKEFNWAVKGKKDIWFLLTDGTLKSVDEMGDLK